jgi:hypothetical protein
LDTCVLELPDDGTEQEFIGAAKAALASVVKYGEAAKLSVTDHWLSVLSAEIMRAEDSKLDNAC